MDTDGSEMSRPLRCGIVHGPRCQTIIVVHYAVDFWSTYVHNLRHGAVEVIAFWSDPTLCAHPPLEHLDMLVNGNGLGNGIW